MATSSIRKQFIVKDFEAFNRLIKDVENDPKREIFVYENSSLNRGRKALKQFSLR